MAGDAHSPIVRRKTGGGGRSGEGRAARRCVSAAGQGWWWATAVADLAHWAKVANSAIYIYIYFFFYFLVFLLQYYRGYFQISGWAMAQPVHPLPPPLADGAASGTLA